MRRLFKGGAYWSKYGKLINTKSSLLENVLIDLFLLHLIIILMGSLSLENNEAIENFSM